MRDLIIKSSVLRMSKKFPRNAPKFYTKKASTLNKSGCLVDPKEA